MAEAGKTLKTAPLTVENGNWGGVSLKTINAVLESAYTVLTKAFEKKPEDVIHVTRWSQEYPFVVYKQRPYLVYLSAQNSYWSQYVYQFSHELCHVLTNFDRAEKHKHKWFEESLCELASLFVLRRVAQTWAEYPPVGIHKAAEFADNHRKYAECVEAKHRKSSPQNIPEWFDKNIHTLERFSEERNLNGVVAIVLSSYFEKDFSLWNECGWLNRWNAEKDESFSDYLDSWGDCLRENGVSDRVPNIIRKLFRPRSREEYSE